MIDIIGYPPKPATRETAEKVLAVVNEGLVRGLGAPVPGEMCVEAAVCYAMGLPHGDNPSCVSPILRVLKIGLNDLLWGSGMSRANGMRRLAIAQLNSAGNLDEKEFARRVLDLIIKKIVPWVIRASLHEVAYPEVRAKLEAFALRCQIEGTAEAVYRAYIDVSISGGSLGGYTLDSMRDFLLDVYCGCTSSYLERKVDLVASGLRCGQGASGAYQNVDLYFAEIAEDIVQILIDMKAPGTEWLDLAPLEEKAS